MNDQIQTTASVKDKSQSRIVILLAAILIALVLNLAFSIAGIIQRGNAMKTIEKTVELNLNLASESTTALDDYRKAAYGNSQVDRIAEQQLLATETTNRELTILSIQISNLSTLLREIGR